LYGGIHYRSDLEDGNEMGRKIGVLVTDRLRLRRTEEERRKTFTASG
jgi:hypothetical protein